ncbi:MAG: aspartate--tRNA ligase [Clostridia bacterium]|nr:aspartate--tRNA ligase [Clostridia bacterium]
MNKYRSHKCNELREEDIGKEVKLSGFVRTIRDLGSLIFVDLKDHYGITQLVLDTEELQESFRSLVTAESTMLAEGIVAKRSNINDKIPTGKIEIIVKKFEVLGKAETVLPFQVDESRKVREDLRLEYRFLDLRNDEIHDKIVFRSKVLKTLRDKMDELGFVEVQTPILANSSPEGARDFLVPSRIHPGEFYALPQAPQQFKQLLMMSGFDKYYQIAPCFRDEDPRADRSPGEFYQLDFEMSFVEEEEVQEVLKEVVGSTFQKFTTKEVVGFERITYKEAMDKYGIDKPDLRNPLVIQDVTEIFKDSEFKVFNQKNIKAIKINAKEATRRFFDDMVKYAVEDLALGGLAWIKYTKDGQVSGTISKFIHEDTLNALKEQLDFKENDAIFFIAETDYLNSCKVAGQIRIELGKRLNIIPNDTYSFCFIVDFPMYELDDNGKIDFAHNPFSMPIGGLESLENKNPLEIVAHQFDLVCNGYELASGAVRNHEIDVMIKAFEIAGYTEEEVMNRFGSLYNAFKYGPPPHAGAAPGIDRMVMLLLEESNIREVIAFPKNSKARDLLMRAPSVVSKQQLEDVHIKLIEDNK